MKCSVCGTDLTPGIDKCPSCGAVIAQANTPQVNVQETNQVEMPQVAAPVAPTTVETPAPQAQGVIDLDEGEADVVHATEDMSAPKLELEQENLATGTQDISNGSNVSTYDPTQEIPQDDNINVPKEAAINFQLPEVKEGAKDTQGMGIMQLNGEGTTANVEVPKEKKKKFSLAFLKATSFSRKFVIIAVIVALLIGGVIGSLLFSKQVYTPGATVKTTKPLVKHVADGKNNETFIGNYKYKIPNTLDFDKSDGGVIVYGSSDEYRIFFKALKGNYDYVANAKESIKKSLENINITVNSISERNIGDTRYVIVEASYGMHNRLYGFRQGNNDDVFYVEIVATENKYDYDALDIADDIIKNAEFNNKYTNMEAIQYEDISAIVVTASEAINNA